MIVVDSYIEFTIRVPYSPLEVKSIWSVAYSWDAHTSETTAMFDGVSDLDLKKSKNMHDPNRGIWIIR